MSQIGRWNGHTFEVGPSLIRSFSGLSIKGGSETEDKTTGDQKYVSRKNGNPREIGLTVSLYARLGCDVRNEALAFVEEATQGAKDYFYMGERKLVTCSVMLTDAEVTEIELTNGGVWTRAEVKCTFKQAGKNDAAGTAATASAYSSSSGGSNKASVKTSSTKGKVTTKMTTGTTKVVSVTPASTGIVSTVKTALSTANSFIKNVGKAVSTAYKKTQVNAAKSKIVSNAIVSRARTSLN